MDLEDYARQLEGWAQEMREWEFMQDMGTWTPGGRDHATQMGCINTVDRLEKLAGTFRRQQARDERERRRQSKIAAMAARTRPGTTSSDLSRG